MQLNLICHICGQEIIDSDCTLRNDNKVVHYFCHKIKNFVLENPQIIENILNEKSSQT